MSKALMALGETVLCACGCGTVRPKYDKNGYERRFVGSHRPHKGRRRKAGGYVLVIVHGHPRANDHGYVQEHVLVAERALGKPLPPKAEPHHLNRIKDDNRGCNLVICPNHKYHKLLHARQRVLERGGDPDIHKICCHCKGVKLKTEFFNCNAKWDGLTPRCKLCQQQWAATYKPVRSARCRERAANRQFSSEANRRRSELLTARNYARYAGPAEAVEQVEVKA